MSIVDVLKSQEASKQASGENFDSNGQSVNQTSLGDDLSKLGSSAGDRTSVCATEQFESRDIEEAEQLRLKLETSEDGRPVMTPAERHCYAIKEMERVVHEFELFTECPCSAQELTGALLQHVLKLTDSKRKV
jgi:hypothetical protein